MADPYYSGTYLGQFLYSDEKSLRAFESDTGWRYSNNFYRADFIYGRFEEYDTGDKKAMVLYSFDGFAWHFLPRISFFLRCTKH